MLDQLAYLSKKSNADKVISMKKALNDSVYFLYQINLLMDEGYRFAIIDENDNKHFIHKKKKRKRKDNKDERQEPEN